MNRPGQTHCPANKRKPRAGRGAFALATAVLLIAVLNLAILGSAVGGAGDATLGARRVQTVRAFFACESGLRVLVGELNAGRVPDEGITELPNGETVEIDLDQTTPPIDATATGRAGEAERSVTVRVE